MGEATFIAVIVTKMVTSTNIVLKIEDISQENFSKDEGENSQNLFLTCNWYLDSSFLNHMIGNKNQFAKLDESVNGKVNFENDNQAKVMEKGTLTTKSKKVCIMYVHDTFFIPSLKHNFLSIGKQNSKNYKIAFERRFCKIFNNNGLVVPMTNNMMSSLRMESNVARLKASVDERWLWHKMFGSLTFGSLLHAKKNLVRGLPLFIEAKNKVRECCAIGNLPNNHFRAHEPLARVHAIICGPIETLSTGKRNYFLLFVHGFQQCLRSISEVRSLKVLLAFKNLKHLLRRN